MSTKKFTEKHLFNSALVLLRKSLNLTQQELANKMSIPRSTLARIETSEVLPEGDFFMALPKVFRSDQIYWLLTGEFPKTMDVEDDERKVFETYQGASLHKRQLVQLSLELPMEEDKKAKK